MFLIPIILVAIISISHVVTWYDMTNPISWAIYLSVAIEIAAMTAVVAVSTRVRGGVWMMFGIVTFIQILGNVFFCFKEIDENGELFKSWVQLTYPFWEMVGTDPGDPIALKRWLAILAGGLLPVISLTSLHFFVNYEYKIIEETEETIKKKEDEVVIVKKQKLSDDYRVEQGEKKPLIKKNLKPKNKKRNGILPTKESKNIKRID